MKYGKVIDGNYTYKADDDLRDVEQVTGFIDARGGTRLQTADMWAHEEYPVRVH